MTNEHSRQTLRPAAGGMITVKVADEIARLKGAAEWRYRDNHLQQQGKDTHPTGIPFFGGTPTGSALNFNKNARPSMSSQPEVEADGPVMRDRLWFMVALARPHTAVTNANVFGFQPGTREFQGWNNEGKLTFTPAPNVRLDPDSVTSVPRVTAPV